VGGNASIAVAYGKHVEEVDGFDIQVGEVGIHLEVAKEGGPEGPVLVGSKSMGRYNSGSCHCCCSMEISAKFIALGSGQSVQPAAWG